MGHFFVFKIIIFQSERLSIRRTLFDWSQRPYLIRPNNNIGSPTCSTIAFSWLLDLESTSNVSKNPLDLSNKSCPFSYTICCNLPSYSAVCIGIPVICILSNIIIISVHVCFCDCSIFCYSLIIIIKDLYLLCWTKVSSSFQKIHGAKVRSMFNFLSPKQILLPRVIKSKKLGSTALHQAAWIGLFLLVRTTKHSIGSALRLVLSSLASRLTVNIFRQLPAQSAALRYTLASTLCPLWYYFIVFTITFLLSASGCGWRAINGCIHGLINVCLWWVCNFEQYGQNGEKLQFNLFLKDWPITFYLGNLDSFNKLICLLGWLQLYI